MSANRFRRILLISFPAGDFVEKIRADERALSSRPRGDVLYQSWLCMSSKDGGTGSGNGSKKVTFGHGDRHLAGTGLSESEVENAIRGQVQKKQIRHRQRGIFWGKIVVQGRQIICRAFTLPDGTINVGTYTVGAP